MTKTKKDKLEDYCYCGHKKSKHYFPNGNNPLKHKEGECMVSVNLVDIAYGKGTPIIFKFEEDPHPFIWFCKCKKYERLPVEYFVEHYLGWVEVFE